MPVTPTHREHPLSMRLPESDLELIDRAARLRGRSRTGFVRDAAIRAAEDVLMEVGLMRMSEQGFASFMAALNAPATVVKPMVELLSRPAPWDNPDTTD